MTICIAAICDEGKACVVAADRMAVFGSGSLLEFKLDDHSKKIHTVSEHSVLLQSGRGQDAEDVVRKLREQQQTAPINDAVDAAAMDIIQRKRDLEVSRRLGTHFNYDQLIKAVGNVPSGPLYDLLQQVRKTDVGDMLVVAMESDRYHIHWVSPPAFPVRSDLDYAAIGSGGIYARAALTIQQYKSDAEVSEALFQVYSAKKAAELVYGVGEPTDMAVLTLAGTKHISDRTLGLLEKVRKERAQFVITKDQSLRLKKSLGVKSAK